MTVLNKPLSESGSWFRMGMVGLLVLSLVLRFWGLGRFNSLVFDEVYYVKFAHDYLTQTPLFDGHPPLSKYLIAIGIWLGNQLPIGHDTANRLAGAAYTTWSYRWLNALTGSFIPLVVAGIAYQLSHRRSYAFLAGLFAALDGLFLVESRYALNNVYLVIFGLMGLWCLLLALEARSTWRSLYLVASGVFFGASASIKWNGLWFLLGAYGLWLSAWLLRWLQVRFANKAEQPLWQTTEVVLGNQTRHSPLQRLTQLAPWQIALNLGIVPAVFYRLIWIPHLSFNTTTSFWALQKQILDYHERVGSGPKVHPYCSEWYTWILMLRPVAYYYKLEAQGGPLLSGNPAVRPGNTVIYDVHAIGNPILWWLSTTAMLLIIEILVFLTVLWCLQKGRRSIACRDAIAWVVNPVEFSLWLLLVLSTFVRLAIERSPTVVATLTWHPSPLLIGLQGFLGVILLYRFINGVRFSLRTELNDQPQQHASGWISTELWLLLFVVVNYAANLLPWVKVTRCTFLYHYMGASVFASLALAWLVDRWLRSQQSHLRTLSIAAIALILIAFVYWLPIYLGLPLLPAGFQQRMVPTWV